LVLLQEYITMHSPLNVKLSMQVTPLYVRPVSSPSFSSINNIKVDRVRKFEEAEHCECL